MVRKTRRRGGKYISSGTYGCAYRPSLKCRGEADREPGTISKLMKTRSAIEELSQKRLLEKIDPDFNFFVYAYKMCIPEDVRVNDAENNIDTCTVNLGTRVKNRGIQKLPDAQLLIYKDGGEDLSRIVVPNEDYAGFFHGFSYLFAGLSRLNNNGILHLDIKPSNLVGVRQADGSYRLRFIDFGLSMKMSTLMDGRNGELYFDNDYAYWSFEIKLLKSSILSGREHVSEAVIQEFYKSFSYNKAMFPYWNWLHADRRPKIAAPWCNAILEEIRSGQITVQDLLMRFDVFALGRTLSEIYCRLTGHYSIGPGQVEVRSPNVGSGAALNAYHTKLRDEVSVPFYRLITKMTGPAFWIRPTAEEAYEEFKTILPAMRANFEEFPKVKKLPPIKDVSPP